MTIPKAKQDPHLFAKLRGELPGILAWAIRGCLEWQREGLGEPEEVRKATEAYRAEMDVLAAYIDERCWLGANAEAQATPLFDDYRSWCDANGERSESQRRFATRLAERGLEKEKVGGVIKWYGIGLLWDGPEGSGLPQGGGPAPSGTSGPSGPKTDMNDKNVVHEGVIPKKGPDGPKGPGRGSSCGEAPLLEGGADRSPPVVDMSTSQENDRNLVRDYLARAPRDLLVHAKKCAREGGVESKLFAPLVSTVAYEVYGTAAGGRCEETRLEVEAWVGSLSWEA